MLKFHYKYISKTPLLDPPPHHQSTHLRLSLAALQPSAARAVPPISLTFPRPNYVLYRIASPTLALYRPQRPLSFPGHHRQDLCQRRAVATPPHLLRAHLLSCLDILDRRSQFDILLLCRTGCLHQQLSFMIVCFTLLLHHHLVADTSLLLLPALDPALVLALFSLRFIQSSHLFHFRQMLSDTFLR